MQIFKVIFLSVIGISIIILVVYSLAWKKPQYFLNVEEQTGLSSFAPISNSNQNKPYIHEQENLIVFCGSDTRNPEDQQIKQLEEKWESLNPDVVLIEGSIGFFLPGIMNPVRKFGVAGMAYELAQQNNTSIYSFNLPAEKIVDKLLNKYPHEQIAVALAIQSYYENAGSRKLNSNDEFMREYLSSLRCSNLNVTIKSAKDIDRIWERDFSKHRNWRILEELPGYVGEIAMEINSIKNKHLLCLIDHFTRQNKKVLVINNFDTLTVIGKN